jgi:two-component system LytT family response regulator
MTTPLIRVVIVEDQPAIRSDIEYLVTQQNGFLIAGVCGTVKDAIELIDKSQPDLLLLDIQLPDGTGFDIVNACPHDYKVIFLTAFENHALQAIKVGALDYLLKPVDETELAEALSKVIEHLPARKEQISIAKNFHRTGIRDRVVLRSQDYIQIVHFKDILYCHSDKGYTAFYLVDGKKIVTSRIIKEYEELMPEPLFIKTHQSYLVNADQIDIYKKEGVIILKNGAEIPVAVRRKEIILNYFNRLNDER